MELALDVDAFIKSHNLENPTLIGHSMYSFSLHALEVPRLTISGAPKRLSHWRYARQTKYPAWSPSTTAR